MQVGQGHMRRRFWNEKIPESWPSPQTMQIA